MEDKDEEGDFNIATGNRAILTLILIMPEANCKIDYKGTASTLN